MIHVILPVYNAEKTLRDSIESILSQTGVQFRVLAVDDGSTDRSGAILDEYSQKDPRILCIHQQNGGVSAARNCALTQVEDADGNDFIAFLDADDRYAPQAFQTMQSLADANQADIVLSRYIREYIDGSTEPSAMLFGDGEVVERSDFQTKVFPFFLRSIHFNHILHTLYRLSAVRGIRMDETMATAEDLCYNVMAYSNADRLCFSGQELYCYKQVKNSLTGNSLSARTKLACNIKASQIIAARLPDWGMDSPKYRFLTAVRPYRMAVQKVKRALS